MPVGYNPRNFFEVATWLPWKGSTAWYLATRRACTLLPIPIILALVHRFALDDAAKATIEQMDLKDVLTPFTLLLGLVTSFRLNDAFHKWEKAGEIIFVLHRELRTALSRLCAFLPSNDPAVLDTVNEIRRLLILGCILMRAHVRHEEKEMTIDKEKKNTLSFLVDQGLLMKEEKKALEAKVTIADGPTGDGKTDKYPSRSRPMFAFQKASTLNHRLFKDKHYTCPHTFFAVETNITSMSSTFEEIEHLQTSLLPLPYAQLTRLLALVYLTLQPVAYWNNPYWMVPLCFLSSLVFFIIDECSGQMEEPFGTDINDVELDKIFRRADKLTAAQLYMFNSSNGPVSNYNLFPESRTTDNTGRQKTQKFGRLMGSMSEAPKECQRPSVVARMRNSLTPRKGGGSRWTESSSGRNSEFPTTPGSSGESPKAKTKSVAIVIEESASSEVTLAPAPAIKAAQLDPTMAPAAAAVSSLPPSTSAAPAAPTPTPTADEVDPTTGIRRKSVSLQVARIEGTPTSSSEQIEGAPSPKAVQLDWVNKAIAADTNSPGTPPP